MELDKYIKLTEDFIKSPNIADKFSDVDLTRIGNRVWAGYNADEQSRVHWLRRTEAAMDLAQQVVKSKSFPWPNCSNIAFPLITIATLQFHAFAYPSIVDGTNVVQYRVIGDDPEGEKKAQAARIGTHMSYQCLEEDSAWEEQHDRALIHIPVVGCAFKKSYYAGSLGHNVSELVLAKDLVLDYYAKSVETAARKTHIIPLFRNDIYFRVKTKTFLDVLEEGWYTSMATGAIGTEENNRSGTTPSIADEETPFIFLEQHCNLDLDGDGYAEPYIVTIEETSRQVVRIVCRFDSLGAITTLDNGDILSIRATEHFTKYGFIPSPDGSIYDMGFGVLLGPLNESVNSLVNQLIDAGTMANTAGGFLGRGAKIRGGNYTFAPLEWKRVDSTGEDLAKSIYPLPVREPSAVLLQLLQVLIQYANRIPGATEAASGENPGQNTPAETHRTSVEQSLKLYNAIFKRIWRSMKEEFKKLYLLNSVHAPIYAQDGLATRSDYQEDPARVAPVADPHVLSDSMRFGQAQALAQRAVMVPGYNMQEVERNYLKSLRIEAWETFYPGPEKFPPPSDPKLEIEKLRMENKQLERDMKSKHFVMELMEEHRLTGAKIAVLEAQAIKLTAEAQGVEKAQMIAAFEAATSALKTHDDSLRNKIELMMKAMEQEHAQNIDRAGLSGLASESSNPSTATASGTMDGRA